MNDADPRFPIHATPAQVRHLHDDLIERAPGFGIRVGQAKLSDEVPGEFDGLSITLNQEYDAVERAFYLAHSIGSIAEWSLDFDQSNRIFRELERAKQHAATDAARFNRWLDAYLAFENRTWQFATGLLQDTGHSRFIPAFSNFGRADMEAMRQFHTTGQAPVWRDFFAAWNEQVRRGVRTIEPFAARPIPDFQAVKIPQQEIVQEDGGEA
jgi:hypothetical protein